MIRCGWWAFDCANSPGLLSRERFPAVVVRVRRVLRSFHGRSYLRSRTREIAVHRIFNRGPRSCRSGRRAELRSSFSESLRQILPITVCCPWSSRPAARAFSRETQSFPQRRVSIAKASFAEHAVLRETWIIVGRTWIMRLRENYHCCPAWGERCCSSSIRASAAIGGNRIDRTKMPTIGRWFDFVIRQRPANERIVPRSRIDLHWSEK